MKPSQKTDQQELVTLPAPNYEDEAKHFLKKAQLRKKRMLNSLAAKLGNSKRQLTRASRLILNDELVIFATLVEAQKVKTEDADTLNDLLEQSKKISMWAQCTEPVYLKKKKGTYSPKPRWFYQLGKIESTRNLLLRQVMAQICQPLPTQFMSRGGIPKFEQWLTANLPKAKCVFTTDIPSYFFAVKRKSVVSGLPIERQVIQRVLFDVMDRGQPLIDGPKGLVATAATNIVLSPFVDVSSSDRGIPVGAAASSLASEMVIKTIFEGVIASTDGVMCGSHGDNLIFLLQDDEALPSLRKAIHHQIMKHIGFDVIDELTRRNNVTLTGEEFLFCGVHYRWDNGALAKRLDELRLGNFALKTEVLIASAITSEDCEDLFHSVKGWMISRQFSKKALLMGADLMAQIGETKAYLAFHSP